MNEENSTKAGANKSTHGTRALWTGTTNSASVGAMATMSLPSIIAQIRRSTFQGLLAGTLVWLCINHSAFAQHEHESSTTKVVAPKIFLDKSPRVVEYQLKRLSNEQLLLVERSTEDKKYLPVFAAILTREGMSRGYREDALAAIVAINQSDRVTELITAIAAIVGSDESSERTIKGLATMLLEQPPETLGAATNQLLGLASSGQALAGPVGYAGLISSGRVAEAWRDASDHQRETQLLDSISLLPSSEVRSTLHARVAEMLQGSGTTAVKQSAIRALASIPAGQELTFSLVSKLIGNENLRTEVVRTLLSVPPPKRDAASSQELIAWLVDFAEQTPVEKRTENEFLDAMELVDQLIGKLPTDRAKSYRARLRETVVRVVRIHAVEEEMRYDIPYFAVEAGRSVQVVLINEDLMPHNLVISMPGTLISVAEDGLAIGPNGGLDGKQYVPIRDDVLFATNMVPARAQESLTFTAPTEPGEYPYVCTFPRHWMRMYGVMVVVEDLDGWLQNPIVPKDPIGSNRQFVQSWTMGDLQGDLENGLNGRTAQIGERIFIEATCAQCHKAAHVGVGNVGPDLSETFARWKGDPKAVLQEILDPSHRIEDKYAVHLILDADGKTTSGLVVSEDNDKVMLLENPEAKEPTVILKADIEQRVKTSNSMMPKGLMDRYSQDEIFELMNFLLSVQKSRAEK